MSSVNIRRALQTALDGITPALTTVYENQAGTPPATGTAYQRAFLLFAEPDNATYGGTYQEQGILQVDLMYPEGTGPAAADARVELLRATFNRGASFAFGGTTVTIQRTPEKMPARNEGGRFIQSVRIRFFAHIISA